MFSSQFHLLILPGFGVDTGCTIKRVAPTVLRTLLMSAKEHVSASCRRVVPIYRLILSRFSKSHDRTSKLGVPGDRLTTVLSASVIHRDLTAYWVQSRSPHLSAWRGESMTEPLTVSISPGPQAGKVCMLNVLLDADLLSASHVRLGLSHTGIVKRRPTPLSLRSLTRDHDFNETGSPLCH